MVSVARVLDSGRGDLRRRRHRHSRAPPRGSARADVRCARRSDPACPRHLRPRTCPDRTAGPADRSPPWPPAARGRRPVRLEPRAGTGGEVVQAGDEAADRVRPRIARSPAAPACSASRLTRTRRIARARRRSSRVRARFPRGVQLAVDAHAAVREVGGADREEAVVDDQHLRVDVGRRGRSRARPRRGSSRGRGACPVPGRARPEPLEVLRLAKPDRELLLQRLGALVDDDDDLEARAARRAHAPTSASQIRRLLKYCVSM